jgi:acyl-CoA dehydrogenase
MKRDELSAIISEQADRQFRELVDRDAIKAASEGRWQGALWRSVEESALSLALVPEAQGGAGLAAQDAFEIVRLSGFRGLPIPLADTLLAKALWSGAGGALEVAGDAPLLLAAGANGQPLTLERGGDGASVSGTTQHVAIGDAEASVLMPVRSTFGEDFLLLLDARLLMAQPRSGTAFEAQRAFRLEALAVDAERMVRWDAGDALAFHAHGALLRSVQMTGAMQRCVELGLQYASERVQFGRAIGRFAPVQDMLVEAAAETAAAVAVVGLATQHWQLRPTGETIFCAAAAKSRCGEAAGKVSALIHQVHGALGFTQEHVLHQFTRRLWAWRDEFGAESFWNRWLGERVCAAPGGQLWTRISAL